jgi:lipoprotein-anchoring transpeptidase ErfK/SrfK
VSQSRAPYGALSALAIFLATGEVAGADALEPLLPPWSSVALSPDVRSVRVPRGEQTIAFAPSRDAARRGTAAEGALLPLFGAAFGPGCRSSWLHVGPEAWLCADEAQLTPASPLAAASAPLPFEDGLPFRYYFAGEGGARAYRRLIDFDIEEPAFELERGFAVALVAEQVLRGERYGYTRRGLWVRMSEFGAAHPSAFVGERLEVADSSAPLSFAWAHRDRVPTYRRVGAAFIATGDVIARHERVTWLGDERVFGTSYARVDEHRWVRAADVRRPSLAAPPDEVDVARGERWIDVELATQTLVAYEGVRPVYATLVSTGRGKTGSVLATPVGTHRIWVKLLSATMDNLEDPEAANYYRIEDVPYVQFFAKGVGLHAAFWHRSFGTTRSHGCVNLAPRDAAWLFSFTGPRVPSGWAAALPTRFERGTVVRVR